MNVVCRSTYLGDCPVDDGFGPVRVVLEAVDVVHGDVEVVSGGQQEPLGGVRVELTCRRLRWVVVEGGGDGGVGWRQVMMTSGDL